MEKHYIEREAAKRAIQMALNDGTGYGEALNAIPAADDVVEVVRCKDCKYWTRLKRMKIYGDCDKDGFRREDFFCADGQRREK